MGTSHLIMGELTDYLTGRTLPDTHDERIIQRIAHFLVDEKGYNIDDIRSRKQLRVSAGGKSGTVTVHFMIRIDDRPFAVIMYGPGSIVTRQRPTLSVARLVEDTIVPFSVITNGDDASLMDSKTGKVIGNGLSAIFSKKEAAERLRGMVPETLTDDRREKEQRILYTMDILTEAECAAFVCRVC